MAGLGEILQHARQARGVSLEEAERVTHIARRYLQALEAESIAAFPAPVFAKGFLRNYSQYLGLDPNEMLMLWPTGTEQQSSPEPAPETTRADFERRARPLRDKSSGRRQLPARGSQPPGPLSRGGAIPDLDAADEPATARPALMLAGAVIVAVVVVAFAVAHFAGQGSSGSAIVPAVQSTATRAATGGSSPPAGGVQPPATQPPPARKAGTMPSFIGKDARGAVQQLQQAGVNPLIITLASPNKSDAPGSVLRQTPSAGSALNTNSSVTLYVNAGTSLSATPIVP